MKNMSADRMRVSRMINSSADANGKCKFGKWAVRSPNSKGATEFRIFPAVKDGVVVPQYLDLEKELENPYEHLSDAILVADACVCWGASNSTFLLPKPAELRRLGFSQSPAHALYWSLRDRVKKNPQQTPNYIHALFQRERGRGELMQRPRPIMMMQGVLLVHGGAPTKDRDGKPKPWYPVVLQLNQATAQKELCTKLTTPADPASPLSEANNQLGPLLTLDGFALVVKPQMVQTQTGDQIRYFCERGRRMVIKPEQAVANYVPWEELLNFPDIPTCIQYISDAIGAAATVLGLKDTPYAGYLPEELMARAERLTGKPVPAGQPAVGQKYAAPAPAAPQHQEPMAAPEPAPLTLDDAVAPAPEDDGTEFPLADEGEEHPAVAAEPVPDCLGPESLADQGEPFSSTPVVPEQSVLMNALRKAQVHLGRKQ
jgi:hypothetical protein